MKKIFFSIIFAAITTLFLYGCQTNSDENTIELEKNILQRVNNTKDKDELATKEYHISSDGMDYYQNTLADINCQFKIECIRKTEKGYYAAIKDDEGGWLYLFFKQNEGRYKVYDYLHFASNQLYLSDFDKIVTGQTSMNQVRIIDPYGEYVDYDNIGRCPFSTHYTIDNYKVEVEYSVENVDNKTVQYVVSRILTEQPDDSPSLLLLPIDK